MLPAFGQLDLLLAFMSIGYFFGKSGLIDHSHSKVLSVAGVYLFLPCTIFNSFSKNFTPDNLNVYAPADRLAGHPPCHLLRAACQPCPAVRTENSP